MKSLILLIGLIIGLQSCDTCKHIPTYGGRAAMVYGHSNEGGHKANKNPYAVKAKKQKSKYRNPYSKW
jgi:hypothetical protein